MGILDEMKPIEETIGKIEVLSDENGKCNGCVECCTIFLPVSKQELKFLKTKYKLIKENIEKIKRNAEKGTLDFRCPFISEKGGCLVYNDRPYICKSFHCNENFRADLNIEKSQLLTHLLIEIYPKKLQEKLTMGLLYNKLGGEIDFGQL